MPYKDIEFLTSNGKLVVRTYLDKKSFDLSNNHDKGIEMLQQYVDKNISKIEHKNSGAPFINNFSGSISISHCKNLYALYYSDTKEPIGVDVERLNPNLKKIKDRFLNTVELQNFNELTDELLHLIWCAKEAVFKYYDGDFAEYLKSITVLEINPEGQIKTQSRFGKLTCNFKILNDNVFLVWV